MKTDQDPSPLSHEALRVLEILRQPLSGVPTSGGFLDARLPELGGSGCGWHEDPFAFKQDIETDLHPGISQLRKKQIESSIRELDLIECRIQVSLSYGLLNYVYLENTASDLVEMVKNIREENFFSSLSPIEAINLSKAIIDRLSLSPSLKMFLENEPFEAKRFLLNASSERDLPDDFRTKLIDQLNKLNYVRSKYQEPLNSDVLFSDNLFLEEISASLIRAREAHRMFISELAGLMDADERFSPAFRGSQTTTKGIHQYTQMPGGDYGRSIPTILTHCEKRFEFGPSDRTSVHLTGGGMQALHLAMKVIDATLAQLQTSPEDRRPALIQKGIYWESDSILQERADADRLHDRTEFFLNLTTDELSRKILDIIPSLVVTAPIGNSPIMGTTDIEGLLNKVSQLDFQSEWIKKTGGKFLTILVDNTTHGETAPWKHMDFSKIPNFVIFCSVESLIKLRQDGFDHAPSGSVEWVSMASNRDYFASKTRFTRSKLGYTPPANTIYKLLLAPSSSYSIERTKMITDNTAALADGFRSFRAGEGMELIVSSEKDSPFFHISLSPQSINWWQKKIEQESSVTLSPAEIEERVLKSFITRSLYNANSSELVPLSDGTSFGFDTTRVCLIKYRDDTDTNETFRSCVRISGGVEDSEQIKKILSAFWSAACEVPRAIWRYEEIEKKSHNLMGPPNIQR